MILGDQLVGLVNILGYFRFVKGFQAEVHPRPGNIYLVSGYLCAGFIEYYRAENMAGGMAAHKSVTSIPIYSPRYPISRSKAGPVQDVDWS